MDGRTDDRPSDQRTDGLTKKWLIESRSTRLKRADGNPTFPTKIAAQKGRLRIRAFDVKNKDVGKATAPTSQPTSPTQMTTYFTHSDDDLPHPPRRRPTSPTQTTTYLTHLTTTYLTHRGDFQISFIMHLHNIPY